MPNPLDPATLFRILDEHEVHYVLIGGLAANLHGSPVVTNDADITPRRDTENLERLAEALKDLGARIRTASEPDGLPFSADAGFLERMKMVNLTTVAGDFDLTFEPAAFPGYETLLARSVRMNLFGIDVQVAALRDIIASKAAADRPKDRRALPDLYALEDEIAALERERRE